jgi:flavin reductase (DIM6/NTAB) family NADH-FMN oxidoreductase RutF
VTAERTFQRLVAQLDYPMFIATVAAGGERAGCLIGFATEGASSIAVHLVPEDAGELAELFGGETGDEVDKFERCDWRPGPKEVPLLDGCPNRFVGRIVERVPFGDHLGMVLEPFFAEEDPEAGQLGFHRAKRIDPGHEA